MYFDLFSKRFNDEFDFVLIPKLNYSILFLEESKIVSLSIEFYTSIILISAWENLKLSFLERFVILFSRSPSFSGLKLSFGCEALTSFSKVWNLLFKVSIDFSRSTIDELEVPYNFSLSSNYLNSFCLSNSPC
jgi:hypothetical protein